MLIINILVLPVVLFLIYLLFLFICSLPIKKNEICVKNSRFYRGILNYSAKVMAFIFRIRIHTDGVEQLPENKKILFVCNHISCYDPILTWLVFEKYDIAFISKPENFDVPFFGKIIRRCCFLPIDRHNAKNAIRTINSASELIKSGECAVGVYPEGTRSKCGELLPFHDGVFRIATKADCDIAVLAVTGTDDVYRNVPIRATDVYIDVAGVIPAQDLRGAKSDEIGRVVRRMIENSLAVRHSEINGKDNREIMAES